MPYQVLVDDNFHYMDEDERFVAGEFDSYAAAVAACQDMVDQFLGGEFERGMSADALFDQYRAFGPDPFIRADDAPQKFSAWTYAKRRCDELCHLDG